MECNAAIENAPGKRRLGKIAFAMLILCGLAFADTIHLKSGDKIENAAIAEITPAEIKYKVGKRAVVYTILKSDALKVVYKDGSEDVFAEPKQEEPPAPLEQSAESAIAADTAAIAENINNAASPDTARYISSLHIFGFGYNSSALGVSYSYAREFEKNFTDLFWGIGGEIDFNAFPSLFIFLQNKHSENFFFGSKLGYTSEDMLLEPFVGFSFNKFSLLLGCNIFSKNIITIGAAYTLEQKSQLSETSKPETEPAKKESSSSSRLFRPGIEINYPVWRSEIEMFDNSFPYMAAGAGLFFRIGPEFFYLTTGAYAKVDVLQKTMTKDLDAFGLTLATIPLLDITWSRLFVEVPLLINFGSGQIRFTGGALLEFYAVSQFDVDVSSDIPLIGGANLISANDAAKIEERFNKNPDGNVYWALGLDFDIVRYWGIGVKYLIWGFALGENEYSSYSGFEPSRFQTRVSTYFVF